MTASLADVPIGTPVYGIGFADAVRRFLRGYVVFRGRASRSEYWWAQLAVQLYVLVVSVVATVFLVVVLVATMPSSSPTSSRDVGVGLGVGLGAILAFYGVFFVLVAPVSLPTYSSGARRLRDAGFSPWLLLLGLVPLGSYAVIVLTIMPTRPGPAWPAAPWQQQAYGPGGPGHAVGHGQPGYGYDAHGQSGYGYDAHGQSGYGYDAYGQPGYGRQPLEQAADDRQHDAGGQRQS